MAKPSILIISAEIPPVRGGVADHTHRLAAGLSENRDVSILTGVTPGGPENGSGNEGGGGGGVRICRRVESWLRPNAIVRAVLESAPRAEIIWQYVPHMYGRGGISPALPAAMAALHRLGRRQLVLAHEIAAPLSLWPNRFVYGCFHRWQWRLMLRCADAIAVSTQSWLHRWTQLSGRGNGKLFLLPSPSNLAPGADNRDPDRIREIKKRWNIAEGIPVMSCFGAITNSTRYSWIVAAWHAAAEATGRVSCLVLGRAGEHGATSEIMRDGATLRTLGYLPERAISEALSATDLLVLPFPDGVSERRGTFMAGLSHGCAVLTTRGANTGSTLSSADWIRTTPARDMDAFAAAAGALTRDGGVLRELGESGRRAYRMQYDWPIALGCVEAALGRIPE